VKCTNNFHIKQLLCLFCTAAIFIAGCGINDSDFINLYDAYSYSNSYTNQETPINSDYYASDLCVTNSINFGTEGTYYEVSQGGGVFNVTTQDVLYSHNMFAKLHPASTTKILTAYIIIRDCDLEEIVTVSESAADQADDSSTCGLKAGDCISVNDLLHGLMLNSGNDAAEALAEHHSGSLEEFALVMTKTAHDLGATNSQFVNPSGLTDKEHFTTVYDMYLMFNEAIKNQKFIDIISSKSHKAVYSDAKGKTVQKTYYNHNRYITGATDTPKGFTVIGGKTGTTYAAGYCLVLYTKNPDNEDIISIVFKADGSHNLYLLMNQILSKHAK